MDGIPALQMPRTPDVANTAAKFMQLQELRNQTEEARVQTQNAAVSKLLDFQMKQKEAQRKVTIEANDFALNLLTGVNSEEDLQIAKRQFLSRYPESAGMVDQILPSYNPRSIDMIRNSLRTETQRLKAEEKEGLKGFAAGTAIYKGEKKIEQVPFAPKKEEYDVFEGPDGNQVYVRKGDKVPEGYTKVMAKGTQVTVQTGDLSKTTKSKLEGDVIEATHNIRSFKDTEAKFKDEYLTYWGKGGRLVAGAMDKAGVSTKRQKKLINQRAKWYRQAKADFISYRKWATGVAGGEKEYKELARAFPDPDRNSPEEYKANLDNMEDTTKKVLALNKEFLRSGIDLNQPLEKILEQARGVGIPSPGGGGGGVVIKFDEKGNRID